MKMDTPRNVKDCRQPPEETRKDLPPEPLREHNLVDILVIEFWPPEL